MHITAEQKAALEKHLSLVIEANKQTNITRIDTREQGLLLHVEDSLVGLDEVKDTPDGPLADLGSGAGYPGIPLAITSGRNITLVESVGKKAHLLEGFVAELGLTAQVEVYAGRAEALAREHPQQYAVVTARALSSLASLMELASPLLWEGGCLVCYKACDIEEELEHARRLEGKLALYLKSVRKTTLSDGQTQRCVVTFTKHGEPTVTLPRREGKAQRSPYKQ